MVDKSTRHFWTASYGQIYPELRRLEERGLVRSTRVASGERERIEYELTEAGAAALTEWLQSGDEPLYELRDEGMLKLFFSDSLPERRVPNIAAMRERAERKLAQLRAIEPHAKQLPAGVGLTVALGIELNTRLIDWCEAAERRLAEE